MHLPPLQEPAEEPQLSMVCSREVSYTGTRINNGRRPKTWMAGMKSRCSDFTMNLYQTVHFFCDEKRFGARGGGAGGSLETVGDRGGSCMRPAALAVLGVVLIEGDGAVADAAAGRGAEVQ